MINLEEKIRPLLAQKKMSIEKLAINIGITRASIHNAFNKNDIKLSQLEKVCEILEVPITYFLDQAVAGHDLGKTSSDLQLYLKTIDELTKDKEELRKDKEDLKIQLKDCQTEVKRLKNGGTPVYEQ